MGELTVLLSNVTPAVVDACAGEGAYFHGACLADSNWFKTKNSDDDGLGALRLCDACDSGGAGCVE